jgi:TetR/AcrR family transcriptional regulator, fatty acid metabolism regulator protein
MRETALAIQKKSTNRKEQILQAAERVFAQKGYQEATIADVARKAKVSEATIYEYFPSKEELLFLIPGATARRGTENLEYLLRFIRSSADKIRAYVYDHLNFYQNHPDYASVAMLILKPNRKFVETEAYKDVQELSRVLLQVIEEGIASGEFRSDFDPYLIRSAILGTIEHLVTRQVLLGKPENLVELVDPLTELIVGGIQAGNPGKDWNLRVVLCENGKKDEEKIPLEGEEKTSRGLKKAKISKS